MMNSLYQEGHFFFSSSTQLIYAACILHWLCGIVCKAGSITVGILSPSLTFQKLGIQSLLN